MLEYTTSVICHNQNIHTLYAHQQPEPIGPDEDDAPPPVKPPSENPPITPPPDRVPDQPEPVPPVPPVTVPGTPDLPGHIISRNASKSTGVH